MTIQDLRGSVDGWVVGWPRSLRIALAVFFAAVAIFCEVGILLNEHMPTHFADTFAFLARHQGDALGIFMGLWGLVALAGAYVIPLVYLLAAYLIWPR